MEMLYGDPITQLQILEEKKEYGKIQFDICGHNSY